MTSEEQEKFLIDEISRLCAQDKDTEEFFKEGLKDGHNALVLLDFFKMYMIGMPGLGIEIMTVNGHETTAICSASEKGMRVLFIRPVPGLDMVHKATGSKGVMSDEAMAEARKKLN